MGGEKKKTVLTRSIFTGSPPRGRGKALSEAVAVTHAGITPAWAGKRLSTHLFFMEKRDHPRVGGEKRQALKLCPLGAGSPPRGRGKGILNVQRDCPPGITPAWAGKSILYYYDYNKL